MTAMPTSTASVGPVRSSESVESGPDQGIDPPPVPPARAGAAAATSSIEATRSTRLRLG